MKTMRCLCAAALGGLLLVSAAPAQEAPKPGPEHEMLGKLVGTWDATMSIAGTETKGTMVYKSELGGLFVSSTFEGDFGGAKFLGKGLDGYDTNKKKFVGTWADSMMTSIMALEGTYDKEKKTMTMSGEAPGPDGKLSKMKMVTEMKDDDNMVFTAYMGDSKEPGFTIKYKRKK
jgi:Protein of unknown function (DUF1579)